MHPVLTLWGGRPRPRRTPLVRLRHASAARTAPSSRGAAPPSVRRLQTGTFSHPPMARTSRETPRHSENAKLSAVVAQVVHDGSAHNTGSRAGHHVRPGE